MKKKRTMAVLGSGRCLWDDYTRLKLLIDREDFEICAVNYTVLFWPWYAEHAASVHADVMDMLLQLRAMRFPAAAKPKTHGLVNYCRLKPEGIDRWWNFGSTSGTSSRFAVQVAHETGFDRIVLCGIPLDGSGDFFDLPGFVHTRFDKSRDIDSAWKGTGLEFSENVRSMSGRTRDWLGEPEKEWFRR